MRGWYQRGPFEGHRAHMRWIALSIVALLLLCVRALPSVDLPAVKFHRCNGAGTPFPVPRTNIASRVRVEPPIDPLLRDMALVLGAGSDKGLIAIHYIAIIVCPMLWR